MEVTLTMLWAVGPCRVNSTKEFVGYFARAATILKQADEELLELRT